MNLAVYLLCGLGSIPDRAQFREYQRTEWGPLGKSLQSHKDRESLMDQSGLWQKKNHRRIINGSRFGVVLSCTRCLLTEKQLLSK